MIALSLCQFRGGIMIVPSMSLRNVHICVIGRLGRYGIGVVVSVSMFRSWPLKSWTHLRFSIVGLFSHVSYPLL